MQFLHLQEKLRRSLLARIEQGELTGLRLAQEAGFKQAHISNFLHAKRGLSLHAMDRILRVQGLSVVDLLELDDINRRATIPPPPETDFENVFLVDPEIAAAAPIIAGRLVKEIHKFRRSFLRRLRSDPAPRSADTQRFVMIRADAALGSSMQPRLSPGATVLIDRHYNSLKPYRRAESNIYAIRKDASCTIRYLELAGQNLVLRPNHPAYPVEVLPIKAGSLPFDYIVGRVCHVGMET